MGSGLMPVLAASWCLTRWIRFPGVRSIKSSCLLRSFASLSRAAMQFFSVISCNSSVATTTRVTAFHGSIATQRLDEKDSIHPESQTESLAISIFDSWRTVAVLYNNRYSTPMTSSFPLKAPEKMYPIRETSCTVLGETGNYAVERRT